MSYVSIGSLDGAREGAPPAVGGEGVERLEGVDGLRDETPSRWESKIWEIKIEQVNFSGLHAAVEPACGRGSAPHSAQKKATIRRGGSWISDSCDAEHPSELDVFHIGKYLQRDYHPTLSEEVITATATRGSRRMQTMTCSRGVLRVRHVHQTTLPELGPQRPLCHVAS